MDDYDWFGFQAKNGNLQRIQEKLAGENPILADCICNDMISSISHYYQYIMPLLIACQEGHLTTVQALICAGADVNWKHVLYKTPLDDAFQNGGSPAWVESVFKRNAWFNATVVTVATPLHKACEYGNSPEMVEALLAAGANIIATIYNGVTPLISALKSHAPIMSRVKIA